MSNIKNEIFFISFVILSYFAFTNCLIRIPIKGVKTKEDSKNNKVKNKEKSLRALETMDYDVGPVTLDENYKFLTNIEIGSNKQKLNLILDTTTDILWVARQQSNAGQINNYYRPSGSDTSKDTREKFTLVYGSGTVSGTYYTDNLKYIGDQNFNMKFGAATSVGRRVEVNDADGIIGLGHYYKDEQFSFLHMLKKYNITNSTLFSLKFNDKIEEGATGDLYIGKHEDFSSKNSVTFSLTKFNNNSNASDSVVGWNIQINGFSLKKGNNEFKYSKNCDILFDTSHNYIVLPYEYLDDIKTNLSDIDCSPEEVDDTYSQLKCLASNDTLPDLRLKINGTTLIIPSNYTFTLSRTHHYSNIYFSKSNYFVLGAPFFFNFHTLFDRDNEQIHFYPNDSKLLEIDEDSKKDGKKDDKDKNKDQDKNKDSQQEEGGKNESGDNTEDNKGKWILIAAIGGGVLLLIILLIIICCCCCCRSKKEKEDEDIEKDVDNTEPIIEDENK